MPTQITQNESDGRMFLRVEGEMLLDDALLLEKIAGSAQNKTELPVIIDLADLDFLDSESAQVLRRMKEAEGFEIVGMEIFLQSAVNSVERANKA